MKGVRAAFLFFLAGVGSASLAAAATELTAEQWREDLQVLAEGIVETHDDAFHTMSEPDFRRAVSELHDAIPSMPPRRIVMEMARLVAMVGDGHTRLSGWLQSAELGFRWYAIGVYWFPDGLHVIQAHPDRAGLVGGRITAVNGVPIDEVFARVAPYVAADNEHGKRAWSPVYLESPEVLLHLGIIDDVERPGFEIERDGRSETVHLKPQDGPRPAFTYGFVAGSEDWAAGGADDRPTPLWLAGLGRRQVHVYLPEHRLFYVQHNQILPEGDRTMDAVWAEIFAAADGHEIDRFVLDLRLNGGGNNYLNRPLITGLLARPEINRRGVLYVIIGRRTFSAAQNLVNELEKYSEAVFVGEPTAERVNFYGDTRPVELPNSGFTARVSWLWWQNLDPRDTRTATEPAVAVDLTVDDWLAGRDPVLQAIIEGRAEPFGDLLRARLADGDIEKTRGWARAQVADNTYRYRNIEAEINALGYELLGADNRALAIAAFRLNVDLYPESWNVYDSLGEALAADRRTDEARTMYWRSLELNPDSPTGHEALARLGGQPPAGDGEPSPHGEAGHAAAAGGRPAGHAASPGGGSGAAVSPDGGSGGAAGAPDDAVEFEGHRYKLFDDVEELSWSSGKEMCASLGGHLAVVTSSAEAEFIGELCDDAYMFLGASDSEEEGTWVWVDGSPFEFTWWLSGQPNDYSGNEDYLATYDGGRWVDVDHQGDDFWMPTGFICEWESAD